MFQTTSHPNLKVFDAGLMGLEKFSAVYLLLGKKNVLIDTGTLESALPLVQAVREQGIVPHSIILTHAHHDQIGGVRALCDTFGRSLVVMAGTKTCQRLETPDQFNRIYSSGHIDPIPGVLEMLDNEVIDFEEYRFQFLHAPGHTEDSMAVYETQTKTLFVGDSIGSWIWGDTYIGPCITADFSEKHYLETLERLASIKFDRIAFSHFGVIEGELARNLPKFLLENYKQWKQLLVPVWKESHDPHALAAVLRDFYKGTSLEKVRAFEPITRVLAQWVTLGFKASKLFE